MGRRERTQAGPRDQSIAGLTPLFYCARQMEKRTGKRKGAGHTNRVPRACAPEYPHSRGRTVAGGEKNAAGKSG